MVFKILWVIDALGALILLYFFFEGLGDGSISASNTGIWLLILAVPAAILAGSIWLRANHRVSIAIALLLVMALPALLYLVFVLIMIFGQGSWN